LPIPITNDSKIESELALLRDQRQRVTELIRAVEHYQKLTDALMCGTAGVDKSRLTLSTLPQTPRKPISA
jgi:hypothetical protein